MLTLDHEGLAGACRRLESLCGGLRPDLVVGIAEGGVEVARRIFPQADHCLIDSSRRRNSLKGKWLSMLPVWLLDLLRMLEMRLRRRSSSVSPPVLSENLIHKARRAECILIVDDAVDSGATLQATLQALRAAAPGARVLSAVLTVTRCNPRVRPDFCCYPEGTLLRFPWSLDVKK